MGNLHAVVSGYSKRMHELVKLAHKEETAVGFRLRPLLLRRLRHKKAPAVELPEPKERRTEVQLISSYSWMSCSMNCWIRCHCCYQSCCWRSR